MLDIANTRFFQFTEKPIISTATRDSIVEGSALVYKTENGIGKVSIGTGNDSEVFAGVAFAGFVRPTILTMQEQVTVDGEALTVTLKKTALSQPMVLLNGVTATVSAGEASSAGTVKYTSSANSLTFNAGDAGKVAVILYRYTPTVAEARAATGDGYAGGFTLSELGGTIGVIHQGQVATDQYDLASNWAQENVSGIKVNADGKFAIGGNGASVTNARVLQAPGFGSQFLILQLL